MLAVIMSFIETRSRNVPRREVLAQTQYVSEGFGYDHIIRDSKYQKNVTDIEKEEQFTKRVLNRALLVCQKAEGIHEPPFALLLITVERSLQSKTGDGDHHTQEVWRYK